MKLTSPPERLDALARDYAAGQMQGGARRRFDQLLRVSPAAQLAVAAWQERLTVLASGARPLEPRPQVWQGLQQRLWGPAAAAPARQPWWRALFGLGGLGSVLAGMLLAVVVLRQQPDWVGLEPYREGLPASYVGLLTDDAGRPAVLASSRRHGRQLTVKLLQPLAVPPGRVAQLWALPKGGGAPVPLGVVPGQGSATLTLPAPSEQLFFGTERLAVSLEASAVAAGATPAAPFVASGFCVKLW
jgi:anti-sigma-K factor RskA